jgi:hypothetical protein
MENWEKPRKIESGHKIFDTGRRALVSVFIVLCRLEGIVK